MKRGKIVTLEIVILLVATLSMCYFIDKTENKETNLEKMLSGTMRFIISDNFVSAAEIGRYTCLQTKNGSYCQEYSYTVCDSMCNGSCIPTSKDQVADCKIGTCYDSNEGTCSVQSPKKLCEQGKGKWFDNPDGNIVECKKGCCLLGDNALFATSQQCNKSSTTLGMKSVFKPEANLEIVCLALAKVQIEGACVIQEDGTNGCKFTTKSDCMARSGQFSAGYLCSSPELNTTCEKQKSVKCEIGKDEVYWYDSCGNRENIYDANKVKSWNNGKILGKSDSCSIASGSNFLANQKTCGNCNYLLGSKCGVKTSSEKLSGGYDYVCKDLSCEDNGKNRKNGESWCFYQGSIGVDGNRATDTPGSRHFRMTCMDGEIRTEACADYRNEICLEQKSSLNKGTFSSAACKINSWQDCLGYNSNDDKEKIKTDCLKNDACFIKDISVSKNFKFSLCTPRYPPGFDLENNAEGAQAICAMGTQKCTVVYIKKLTGWKIVANKDCTTKKFAEQMNDLCMSLGDCGTKVNYEGDLTINSKVYKKGSKVENPFSTTYLNGLKKYSETVPGQYIKFNKNPNDSALGIPETLGDPGEFLSPSIMEFLMTGGVGVLVTLLASSFSSTPTVAGGISTPSADALQIARFVTPTPAVAGSLKTVAGLPAEAAAKGITVSSTGVPTYATPGDASISWGTPSYDIGTAPGELAKIGEIGGGYGGGTTAGAESAAGYNYKPSPSSGGGGASSPGMSALMKGIQIVGIAYSVYSIIKMYAFGPTKDYAALAAVGLLTYGAYKAIVLAFPKIGFLSALGIALFVAQLVMMIFGLGKTKKVTYEFKCNPWEPPIGEVNCERCGSDDMPCSYYSCRSLGQSCTFLNEGTKEEKCIDIAPEDVSAPVISPLPVPLFNYTDVSDKGFSVRGADECISSYSNIAFGIQLNEPGQCRIDNKHTNDFVSMENSFADSNLFRYNNTMGFVIPSLESLGLPGYDPMRKTDYPLYIRCRDNKGNFNVQEYVINFCVKPGDDLTAPSINKHLPENEFISYNATNVNISVFTNEPSECKWDYSANITYNNMINNMNCTNGLDEQTVYGWKCDSNVDVKKNSTNAYVKCKDQPWLVEANGTDGAYILVEEGPTDAEIEQANGDDETTATGNEVSTLKKVPVNNNKKRNSNIESYEIRLTKSSSQLKIDSISPNNETLIFGTQLASLSLEVETSGGVDGTAQCFFRFGDQDISFADTFKRTHVQLFNTLPMGSYNIPIGCVDLAGNVASKSTKFEIKLDNEAPVITRMYNQNGNLHIITNEIATCAFVKTEPKRTDACNFLWENATLMDGNNQNHITTFEPKKNHFIRCKDQFGNTVGGCQMVVRGGI